jgi:hypothetical protein
MFHQQKGAKHTHLPNASFSLFFIINSFASCIADVNLLFTALNSSNAAGCKPVTLLRRKK